MTDLVTSVGDLLIELTRVGNTQSGMKHVSWISMLDASLGQ